MKLQKHVLSIETEVEHDTGLDASRSCDALRITNIYFVPLPKFTSMEHDCKIRELVFIG
jgi:hypothetical protein